MDDLQTQSLAGWVTEKVQDWRDNERDNYYNRWDEYERLWRGKWASEDKTRNSERSRLIAPALQQAVESNAAEIEEATFGRGRWFDLEDDDDQKDDIEFLKNKLSDEFKINKTRRDISECIINAAVWGTGIGEIVVEETIDIRPATQPVMDGALKAVGTEEGRRVAVKLKPILPKNFHIDPHATSVENAMGCAIEEFVSTHSVIQLQEEGVYNDVPLGTSSSDPDLESSLNDTYYDDDKVKLTKYFGLVPSDMLYPVDEESEETQPATQYVEAIVVIANDDVLLKATASPYMMKDRPIVAFQWDVCPSEFWGRGVCEKGYNSQKALDAEIRARIDALALTVHPMIGVDGTKIPRGTDFSVRPGRSLIFNGNPSEAMQPISFGNVSQITFAQASELQRMVQQATGAVDSTSMPMAAAAGEGTAAGISMSIGAVIKRHKRTLINFQESFLIPLVEKTAWRYMQFDPDNTPVGDYRFIVSSSLGIIAREYEVGQLVQILNVAKDGPLFPVLLTSVIDNMNLSNREEILKTLAQAQQVSPEAQQQAQRAKEREEEAHRAQVSVYHGQASEFNARAGKYQKDTELADKELQIELIDAVVAHLPKDDTEDQFNRRMKIAELLLKNKAQQKPKPQGRLKYNPATGQLGG